MHLLGNAMHHIDGLLDHLGAALGTEIGVVRGVIGDGRGLGDRQLAVDLIGDHGGELDDLVELAVGIVHRVVGSLQPDRPAMGIDALEAVRNVLAAVQAGPEIPIGSGFGLFAFAEHAVVLALDLLEAIAHAVEEALVGRDDMPAQVEFDDGGGAQQCVDHALVLA